MIEKSLKRRCIMNMLQKLLFCLSLFLVCDLYSHHKKQVLEGEEKDWKIVFFREYMKLYDDLDDLDHKGISQILQKSFAKAKGVIPEKDKDLAAGVQDQIAFFVGLKDPVVIAREVKKCKDGMKEAHGFWAKLASESMKAHKFVDRFYKEYAKRQNSGQR